MKRATLELVRRGRSLFAKAIERDLRDGKIDESRAKKLRRQLQQITGQFFFNRTEPNE